MKVIIMRGIPGCGKTYVAHKLATDNGRVIRDPYRMRDRVRKDASNSYAIVSADHYFSDDLGNNYKFDPSKLTEAHASCFTEYLSALQSSIGMVIVDNTNLSNWEISPYVLAANSFGYEHEIMSVYCDQQIAFERQTHGVPKHAHERMYQSFGNEKPLPFWNVTNYENTP